MTKTVQCPECGASIEVDASTGHRPGGVTAAVYEYVATHPEATRRDALKWASANGYNELTVLTQFGHAKRDAKKAAARKG